MIFKINYNTSLPNREEDNCQEGQSSGRTIVREDNSQGGQMSEGHLSGRTFVHDAFFKLWRIGYHWKDLDA